MYVKCFVIKVKLFSKTQNKRLPFNQQQTAEAAAAAPTKTSNPNSSNWSQPSAKPNSQSQPASRGIKGRLITPSHQDQMVRYFLFKTQITFIIIISTTPHHTSIIAMYRDGMRKTKSAVSWGETWRSVLNCNWKNKKEFQSIICHSEDGGME